MFEEGETELRNQAMMSPKKGKKKGRAQTAASPGKMSATTKTSIVTTSQVVSGPVSTMYVNRGYTEQGVELDHLRTVEVEVKRERGVTMSVQADNATLREQLARANERINGLEQVRQTQANDISQLEKVRDTQATHITQLEQVRN